MSNTTNKPKLTGWAAAAAKAAPKTHQKGTHSPSPSAHTSALRSKSGTPPPPNKDARKAKKSQGGAPFNGEAVTRFLRELYITESTRPDTVTYTRSKNKSSPDWGTTNNRSKGKKYGCLNEVAKALRS